jgi:hypothetical protein
MAWTARSIGYVGSGYVGSNRLPIPREVEYSLAYAFESKERMPSVTDVTMLDLPLARVRECRTGPVKSAKAEQQKR